jgi:tetratricopeptide (TPR) repeat protein
MTSLMYSQNYKKLDSIIKAASADMYVNPENVIKTGLLVVKQAGNNVDYKIKGLKMISDGYSSKRDYEKSLEYIVKANQLLHLTNNKLLKISILNKLGIQYHQLKIFDKAIQYLDQAAELIMDYPVKDSIHGNLGRNFVVRGFIYKEKFSCNIAIEFFNRGISELLKSGLKSDNAIISIAKYNKGNCYLLLSNNKLAIVNFQEAIQFSKIINAKSLQSFALKGLAKVYTLEGKYSEAITALNEAMSISTDVNDLILNQEIFKGLSENYLALNQWEDFKKYQNKYLNTQSLIKFRERTSVSKSLDVKATELNTKLGSETSKFYYFALLSSIVFLVTITFLYFFVKKNKNDILQIKNQIYLLQNKNAT